jgi:hypothetical protein
VHAVVASRADLTGKVEDTSSAKRILDQVELVLDEPYYDKYTGRDTEVHRCWVVTSGRILASAMESIAGKLQKSNLSKVLHFVDGERLIGLVDRFYPSYWTRTPQFSPEGILEQEDRSPDQRFAVRCTYSLDYAGIRDLQSGADILALPSGGDMLEPTIIWSPDCSYVAYYSPYPGGGRTTIVQLSDTGATLLYRPEYELPFEKELDAQKRQGKNHTWPSDHEKPVRWTSNSTVLLFRSGRSFF